jgi:hypothetical protein
VTAIDESSKLAALKRARERLEAALAVDENWQALRRFGAAAEAGAGEAARLEALLHSNPLYRAWKNVNAAIEARRTQNPVDTLPGVQTPPAAAHAVDAARACPAPSGADRQQAKLTAAEASVSFVARAPAPALPRSLPDREQPQQDSLHVEPRGSSVEKAGGIAGQANGSPLPAAAAAEEAEVSVVSVDARRHADAVERLLRALHGHRAP